MRCFRPLHLNEKIALLVCVVVALSLVVTVVGISYYVKNLITDNLSGRGIVIARSVANEKSVIAALKNHNPAGVQESCERIRKITGVRFVVVFDEKSERFSHPNPAEIGLHLIGGDETPTLQGNEYVSVAKGTLGTALRAFSPVCDEKGAVIGGVVVGILIDNLDQAIWNSRRIIFLVMVFGLLTGCIGSYYLARNIKKGLFGYEPQQIAAILEERNAVLQGIKEGVIVINGDGKVTILNEASKKMLEGADNFLGHSIEKVIPNTRLNDVLQSGRPEYDQVQEMNGRLILTNRIPVLVRGAVIGAVATFRDMTEMKKLADELAGITIYAGALRAQAHEFMNKLHVLWGLTKMECYDEMLEYITSIVSAAETEAQIVINRVKVPVVAGLLIAKYSSLRELGAELTLDPTTLLPDGTFVPASDIVTMLGNLIDNAADAIKSQPVRKVLVFLRGGADVLEIVVSDTGPGIDEKAGKQIFEWGYSTKGGQRGIGLSLVKETTKKYNGAVTYKNSETGCSFFVTCQRGS